jgi:hypothetical protein
MFLLLPVQVEAGVDVGSLIATVCRELDMPHTEAWIICGYRDGAQWHRALKGEAPLDLWKLRLLPWKFWERFLPRLGSALIARFFTDLIGPYRMVRADMDQRESEKRSA